MQRILYIDILKLFTIFLVIWGHAIMHFQPDYDKSIVFQFIYSFHMPLFYPFWLFCHIIDDAGSQGILSKENETTAVTLSFLGHCMLASHINRTYRREI